MFEYTGITQYSLAFQGAWGFALRFLLLFIISLVINGYFPWSFC